MDGVEKNEIVLMRVAGDRGGGILHVTGLLMKDRALIGSLPPGRWMG